jgi:hypothetical protein
MSGAIRREETDAGARSATGVLVYVALELPLDQEVVTQAMAGLRPHWSVRAVPPHELNAHVLHEHPHVVICSEPTAVVMAHAPVWLQLYPNGSYRCAIGRGTQREETPSLRLNTFFDLIDVEQNEPARQGMP